MKLLSPGCLDCVLTLYIGRRIRLDTLRVIG